MKDEKNGEELNFYGSDPGAVKYGNFINYYSFHDVKERIINLHPKMFPTTSKDQIICLDIGCNTGELTQALYNYLKPVYPDSNILILGIDIDSTLIERANESNVNPDNITFITCNIMNENGRLIINQYLETCGQTTFDITFCFSVTMWIHLNNGDEGLLEFLKYLKCISRTIIIEPQPWKCYRSAQRRIKKSGKSFDFYETLKIKSSVNDVIEKQLADGFHYKSYESRNSAWNRRVQSYHLTDVTSS